MGTHTRRGRMRRIKQAVSEWCRRHRHLSIPQQHAALVRRIQGHLNYFGVRGNARRLKLVLHAAERSWFKWLNRRSQRVKLTWERFRALLSDSPFPAPRARHALWGVAR